MSETARSTGGAAHPAGRAQAGAPRRGRPWRNWSGSARAHPVLTATPRSVDEVIAAVQVARDRGLTVKAVGAGHSFTPIAATDGIQLDLAALSGIRAVDGNLVTLGAGTPLHRLPALLSPLGLAMPNLGDIDRQTIAGATATGTHGTGLAFGGLATRIRAVTMVTAAGELLTVSDPVRLPAVALGLGALGLLVDVTLELAPAFALHGLERPMPTAEVLERWPELIRDSDHFEFYVWPHTETSLTKLNTRLPADTVLDPPSGFEQWLTDRTENQVFTASLGLSTAIPPLVGPLNRLGVRLTGDREYTDRSQAVFTSLRTTRFNEQEYGIPVAAVPDAIHAILDLIRARGWRIRPPPG